MKKHYKKRYGGNDGQFLVNMDHNSLIDLIFLKKEQMAVADTEPLLQDVLRKFCDANHPQNKNSDGLSKEIISQLQQKSDTVDRANFLEALQDKTFGSYRPMKVLLENSADLSDEENYEELQENDGYLL